MPRSAPVQTTNARSGQAIRREALSLQAERWTHNVRMRRGKTSRRSLWIPGRLIRLAQRFFARHGFEVYRYELWRRWQRGHGDAPRVYAGGRLALAGASQLPLADELWGIG